MAFQPPVYREGDPRFACGPVDCASAMFIEVEMMQADKKTKNELRACPIRGVAH
jgi:hypothetical protein